MAAIGDAVGDIASQATSIASDAARISDSSSDFQTTIEQLSAAVDRSSGTLTEARDRVTRLIDSAERLAGVCAGAGAGDVDGPFIDRVQDVAPRISDAFDAAVAPGERTREQLLDHENRRRAVKGRTG